jgi:hypothetical protein
MEAGVEVVKEEATVVAARARRRHPPVDAEDVVDGAARAAQRCHLHRQLLYLLPRPSTPVPEHVDGFEFSVTLNYGGNPDSIRLPRKFGDMVDVRTNPVLLRVRGGATGLWTAEVLFDHSGTPYLAGGWRRFSQRHEIVAMHFLFFNYDGDQQVTVMVFDETMCRRHYVVPVRGKAAVSSSSEDDE